MPANPPAVSESVPEFPPEAERLLRQCPLPWTYNPNAATCGNGSDIDVIYDAKGECVASSYNVSYSLMQALIELPTWLSQLTALNQALDAKMRECEELRTHLVATANQVQDNCWCAPGDKCPAHAAREYLQESTHATN